MILVCDIGNTSIKIGIFKNHNLLCKMRFFNDCLTIKDEFYNSLFNFCNENNINSSDIKDGLICSVVPSLGYLLKRHLDSFFSLSLNFIDNSYKNDFKIEIDDPNELGYDLLADLAAVKYDHLYPCIFIDFGTVTKICLIDRDCSFQGAYFYPGIQTSLNAMASSASFLGKISTHEVAFNKIGKNSIDSMMSGVHINTLHTLKGLKKHYDSIYDNDINYIITGTDATLFKEELKDFIYKPDLTLKGIEILFNKNKEII